MAHGSIPIKFFFFNDTATTEIYTLSLHDALPISRTCSMAFRWLARRLLNSLRSPMMWSMARRCSSRFRRRRSSVSTCARSRCSAVRCSVAVSGIAITLSRASAFRLRPQTLELLFEGDHLQLAADDYFFEFLEIQDLLLELALGLLQEKILDLEKFEE